MTKNTNIFKTDREKKIRIYFYSNEANFLTLEQDL